MRLKFKQINYKSKSNLYLYMTLVHKTLNLFLVNALADFCCRLLYSGSDLIASNLCNDTIQHVSRTFLDKSGAGKQRQSSTAALTVGISGLLSHED